MVCIVTVYSPQHRIADLTDMSYISWFRMSAALARKIADAANTEWDQEGAQRFILENHTWDARAAVYHRLLRDDSAESPK